MSGSHNAPKVRRILFVIEDQPVSPNSIGGASALVYNHLELLHQAGWQIRLLILGENEQPLQFQAFQNQQPETWQQLNYWLEHTVYRQLTYRTEGSSKVKHLLETLTDPAAFLISAANPTNSQFIRDQVNTIGAERVWAEDLLPAILAQRARLDLPVIYSHHDWKWRLEGYRTPYKSLAKRYQLWLRKRVEWSTVRGVTACVSGSRTELNEMEQIGVKHIFYLPALYEINDPGEQADALGEPRIVHLGGMRATANRLGLQRFMEIGWPIYAAGFSQRAKLWVIGSLAGASPELEQELRENAICTGFVGDLGKVLRPYDIQIVPWEHNTGTRTRLPVALAYRQVIVSTRAAASCLPELVDDINCILVDSLERMAEVIRQLVNQPGTRKQLGDAARGTFEKFFTLPANQVRFESFLNSSL